MPNAIAYADGQFIADDSPQASLHERGFRFGDGIFDTAIIYNSRLFDWPRHLSRLARGMAHYGLEADVSNSESILKELISRNAVREGYARLAITRGENAPGTVGYKPCGSAPKIYAQVSHAPFPAWKNIRLHVCSAPASWVTPCKTLSSMPYVMAFREAEAAGAENALLLAHDGTVCETANGNLLWIRGSTLFTPSDDLPLVPGTMRERLLELWPERIARGRFSVAALAEAEEIFMTNVGGIVTSIREIAPLGIMPQSTEQTQMLRARLTDSIRAACIS